MRLRIALGACCTAALAGMLVGCAGDIFGTATKAADAGADAGDATDASDPGVDAASFDAGTDAPGASDAGSSYCAKHPGHTFCDDFDLGPLESLVTSYATGGGTVQLDDVFAASAPRSALSLSPAISSGTESAFISHAPFPVTGGKGVKLELQLRVETNLQGEPHVLALSFSGGGSTTYEVFVGMVGANTYINEFATPGGSIGNFAVGPSIPIGAWHDVVLDVNLGGKLVTLVVDGAAATRPLAPPAAFTQATFSVGDSYCGAACGTAAVRADNLTFDP